MDKLLEKYGVSVEDVSYVSTLGNQTEYECLYWLYATSMVKSGKTKKEVAPFEEWELHQRHKACEYLLDCLELNEELRDNTHFLIIQNIYGVNDDKKGRVIYERADNKFTITGPFPDTFGK
jgi:hypothetical protein